MALRGINPLVGRTIEFINGATRGVQGVIVKDTNQLWGFSLRVQVVNGNALYERGEIVEARLQDTVQITKIPTT